MQAMAFSVRGKPMMGRHCVIVSISISRLLPTLRFPPACALAYGSQPPRQQMAQKVINSRICKSSVSLV